MIESLNRKVVSPIVTALFICSSHADERIMVEGAKLNGHPVRLAFDTGAGGLVLFSPAAERLNLRVYPVKNLWRQTLYQATEKCTVDFWSFSRKERVGVFKVPSYLHESMDGLVGWSAVSDQVLVFNTLSNTVQFVREVPQEAAQWTRLDLRFWETTLVLKAPEHGRTGFIVVDTGSESGLGLSPPLWRAWRGFRPAQPVDLPPFYMPAPGRAFA